MTHEAAFVVYECTALGHEKSFGSRIVVAEADDPEKSLGGVLHFPQMREVHRDTGS